MVEATTIERLRWHAGLQQTSGMDGQSIASSVGQAGNPRGRLEQAVSDCLITLATLNREMNGEQPSAAGVGINDLPRSLVYAMTEILRLVRRGVEQAGAQYDVKASSRAAWRLEVAWSAVLAGDIDDVLEHVEQEESARFA